MYVCEDIYIYMTQPYLYFPINTDQTLSLCGDAKVEHVEGLLTLR